jgi:hypothetical protein
MHRGQATIEYVLLLTALMLGLCVLVRYETPVRWLARAIAHALPHRQGGAGGGGHHHRPGQRRPRPCLCPQPEEVGRLTSPYPGN